MILCRRLFYSNDEENEEISRIVTKVQKVRLMLTFMKDIVIYGLLCLVLIKYRIINLLVVIIPVGSGGTLFQFNVSSLGAKRRLRHAAINSLQNKHIDLSTARASTSWSAQGSCEYFQQFFCPRVFVIG